MKPYKINLLLLMLLASFFLVSCVKKAQISQPVSCTADFFYGNGRFRTDSFTTISPEYSEGPVVNGIFQASSAGLIIDSVTGQIDVENSSPGGYTIRKVMIGTPSCGNRIAQAYVTILPPPPPPVLLHNCDSWTGWNFNGLARLEPNDKKEGAFAMMVVLAGNPVIGQIDFNPPVDVKTSRALGELRFWFFVSHPENLSPNSEVGQFELTSSGSPDNQEFTWRIIPANLNLQPGWNYLRLRFREAEITGGTPDLTKINFFRCYIFANTGPLTIGFDDMKVYNGDQ